MVDEHDNIGNKGSTFVSYFWYWAVSSVGRASRLHRLSLWFISPANPNLIPNTTFLVTLTSQFVTKKRRK